jgi:FlaA1/EpsC-like NDP-sugar epimerase
MAAWIQALVRSFLRTTPLKRKAFFLVSDTAIISFSLWASFWMRFDGRIPAVYARRLPEYLALALVVKIGFLAVRGLYGMSWRFFSLRELVKLLQALILASLTMALISIFADHSAQHFPRSILIVDFNVTLALMGTLRILKRAVKENLWLKADRARAKTRILIIGAGSAGEQIGREMVISKHSRYWPIGYVDDDPAKHGVDIHGVKVLGSRADLPRILAESHVEEVLVAIPSADSSAIRGLVETVRRAGRVTSIKILPNIIDLVDRTVALSDIQQIRVEDLLGREPVKVDFAAIRGFLAGKRVLVTGAGGSIGSELGRTVQQFEPARLGLLDNDETELFNLLNRLGKTRGILPIVGDIRDTAKMESVFAGFRPEVVLHAAAYKHVPILEHYPEEAVKTNVLGIKILSQAAVRHGVARFVNISTDKAINPSSVMGATKRVGEEYLKMKDGDGGTQFISVRFGNVLGSRGSVIPLFQEQIRKGGPVTVTHPQMKRYFMAPSEAILLVLQAAAGGRGGDVYVLDMGEPVNIADLAREMIRLSGFEPDAEIPIVFTGLRAGEKLFEEILGTEEGSEATEHDKIFRVRSSLARDNGAVREQVDRLIALSEKGFRPGEIGALLKEIVPSYIPDGAPADIGHW